MRTMILRAIGKRPVWDRRPKVGLSVGHCLLVPGAINSGFGLVEFNLCVLIVREMATLLQAQGYLPFVPDTHELARKPDIVRTVDELQSSGAVAVVEMHLNAFEDSTAHGSETIWSGDQKKDGRSRTLAYYVQEQIRADLRPIDSRGVKTQDDVGSKMFLRDIKGIPHCIVEPCFLSNTREAAWIRLDASRKEVARAVTNGIVGFLQGRSRAHDGQA